MCNVKITSVHLTRAGFKKRVLQRFPVRSRGQRSSPACPDPPLHREPPQRAQTLHFSQLLQRPPGTAVCVAPPPPLPTPVVGEGCALRKTGALLAIGRVEPQRPAWLGCRRPLLAASRIKHRNFEVFEVRETPTLQRPGSPFHPRDTCALVSVGRLPYSAQFPGGAHTRVTGICGQQAARMFPHLQGLQWRRNPENS